MRGRDQGLTRVDGPEAVQDGAHDELGRALLLPASKGSQRLMRLRRSEKNSPRCTIDDPAGRHPLGLAAVVVVEDRPRPGLAKLAHAS